MLIYGGTRSNALIGSTCISIIIGLFVFVQGFLLTRNAVSITSHCQDYGEAVHNDCWVQRSFNRTVVVLIDGLRYDFTQYDETLKPENTPNYLNKMPIFKKIMSQRRKADITNCTNCTSDESRRPRVGFLSQFIADAPTTTMQRLKGLVTGGLPTFIDVAHNFDSPRISEDSVIQQLRAQGRNITVLGDDTWQSLFPDSISRSFLYPSFDVRDLHTVDNGIISHLESELLRDDYTLLVAHFLGVDHAGHRYGPDHQEMAMKLKQMNEIVRMVSELIRPDTLLLVLGDHGMTSSGDHGGDSHSEVTSAIFAYSPRGIYAGTDEEDSPLQEPTFPAVVQQVSLVPTLSLLLGVPIAFSNIGSVVPELFGSRQLEALNVNVQQVHRYLAMYNDRFRNNKFPQNMWKELQSMKSDIDVLTKLNLEKTEDMETYKDVAKRVKGAIISSDNYLPKVPKLQKILYTNYLTLAKAMCEEVWATFDVSEMVSGIILMIVTISNLFVIVLSLTKKDDVQLYLLKGNCIIIIIIIVTLLLKYFIQAPVVNFLPGLFAGAVVMFHCSKISRLSIFAASKDVIPLLIFSLICLGNFSNSFVVHEDSMVAFCMITLFTFLTLRVLFVHRNKTFENGKIVKLERISLLTSVVSVTSCVLSCAAVRAGQMFYRCREEQVNCIPTNSYLTLSSIQVELQNPRYFTGVFVLVVLTYVPKYWMSYTGNLNGSRLAVFVSLYCPGFCALMTGAYWAMEAVPKVPEFTLLYTDYPARAVYAIALLVILAVLYKPLMIYKLQRSKHSYPMATTAKQQLIPELFRDLKAEYGKENMDSCRNTPVVYGLATAVSAPLVLLCVTLLLVLTLLLGDGVAPAVLALVVMVVGWCILNSITCWTSPALDSVMRLRWINPVFWFVLSLHTFYSFGHQSNFSTIPWNAAFVGGSSEGTLVPGLLVGAHVYGGHILLGIALPLLSLAPLAIAVMWPELRKNRSSGDLSRGEFILVDRPEVFVAASSSTALAYLGLHATKVLFSCVSSLILRRHLMMWKVFAPHFVFQAVGLVVSCVSVLVGQLAAHRVLGALDTWASDITSVKVKTL